MTIRSRYTPIYVLPAALAFAGPLFLAVVTGGKFLPLAVAWWVAAGAVACIDRRGTRIPVTIALMPLCVLLTFEGGLYMLPALVTLLAIDTTRADTRDALTTS